MLSYMQEQQQPNVQKDQVLVVSMVIRLQMQASQILN